MENKEKFKVGDLACYCPLSKDDVLGLVMIVGEEKTEYGKIYKLYWIWIKEDVDWRGAFIHQFDNFRQNHMRSYYKLCSKGKT